MAIFEKEKFDRWLDAYKADFSDFWWRKERYKWVAVKKFQDTWDIDAPDFASMLEAALSETDNLLDTKWQYPRMMIVKFAKTAPEEIRSMFRELFNEEEAVIGRIERFKNRAAAAREKYHPKDVNHYQREDAISVYLWLRYPDKYYVYKYTIAQNVAKALGSELPFKQGSYESNLGSFYKLYDSLHDSLALDADLRQMLESSLDEGCYPDTQERTLTADFGYYVSEMGQKPSTNAEPPTDTPSDSNPESGLEEPSKHSGAHPDTRHWWLNANPKIWSFAAAPVGELQSYTLLNENGNKRRIYQNFIDAKPGDTIIGYEASPVKQIVALGKVVHGSDGEKITFVKEESLLNPIDYQVLKETPGLQDLEFFANPNGSLFRVTDDEQSIIMDIVREENPILENSKVEPYGKNEFLSQVYLPESGYDKLIALLKRKKNLILQGAPGTGKTFAAKRLAYAMMGAQDDDRIEFVQFHQNYSYEDFVMGYKPANEGFELKNGIFFRFCQKAANHPDDAFFFIIDEINRANLSKVFGELLMLIEGGHRGDSTTLAYSGLPFSVPKNIYVIGMMNTADRSLAMIDYALRRRFVFFEMKPAFQSEGFTKEMSNHNSELLYRLIAEIEELNKEITTDRSLGRGFQVGHSYFCNLEDASQETLLSLIEAEITPLLEEYWFDNDEKVQFWDNKLKAALQ